MTSHGQLRMDFAAAPDAVVAVPPDLVPASSPAAQPADGKAQQTTPERREFALKGLDGGNPLGFLAAVGALQSATAMEPAGDWRMWWQQDDGPWHPTLAGITDLAAEQLVDRLADYCAMPTTTRWQSAKISPSARMHSAKSPRARKTLPIMPAAAAPIS